MLPEYLIDPFPSDESTDCSHVRVIAPVPLNPRDEYLFELYDQGDAIERAIVGLQRIRAAAALVAVAAVEAIYLATWALA